MKSVAVLMVSAVVIGLVVRYCFLPPRRMPDYVLGDDKCDMCGEQATYRLTVEGRYLKGEYCDAHRWMGVINSDPMSKVVKVVLGASVFGVIYAVLSLLAGSRHGGLDNNVVGD